MDKAIKRTFQIPIYFAKLTVIVCDDLQKWVDKMGIDFDANGYSAVTVKEMTNTGERKYFIFLTPDCDEGDIAHECKHVLNMIFKFIGLRLDTENDEAECYFLGWLVNKVMSVYKQYKNAEPGATN